MSLHLNIGAGPPPLHPQHVELMRGYAPLSEWVLVDRYITAPGYKNWDACAIPLVPGTVDTIYSSHLLEHLPARSITATLAHWRALLKPGGALILNVPDLEWACRRFLELLEFERGGPVAPAEPNYYGSTIDYNGDRSMLAVIFGTQSHVGEHHHTGFTRESLTERLFMTGLIPERVDCVVEAHEMGCLIAVARAPSP